MGAALSYKDREFIVKQKLQGKSLRVIAQENNFSYSTSCRIWRRFKRKGFEGLSADYTNCGPTTIKSSPKIYRCSIWLKRKYPKWGAPLILLILEDRYPDEVLPAVRTMQLWFRKAGLSLPKAYRKEPVIEKVVAVHDRWQIDAKENLQLKDGSKACYLSVIDVKSGAALGAPVFPQSKDQSGKS